MTTDDVTTGPCYDMTLPDILTDSSLGQAYFDYLETWPGLRTWVFNDEIKVYRTPEILGILPYNSPLGSKIM